MKDLFTVEKLKYVGAGAIVLTAFALMFPQVLGFACSLARVGTVILICLTVTGVVVFCLRFFRRKPKSDDGESDDAGSKST